MGSNLGRTLAACGGGKSLCVRPVYMGFGVHTALKMGSNCVGCTGHKARLETILFIDHTLSHLLFDILLFIYI